MDNSYSEFHIIVVIAIMLTFLLLLFLFPNYPYQHSERHVRRSIQYIGIGMFICFMPVLNLCSFIIDSSTPRWKRNYVFPCYIVFNTCFINKEAKQDGLREVVSHKLVYLGQRLF